MLGRLVDQGNSVIVIEHNLDVIKTADWMIDMGPEGGNGGGLVVAEGTPEEVAAHPDSHTGAFLEPLLDGRHATAARQAAQGAAAAARRHEGRHQATRPRRPREASPPPGRRPAKKATAARRAAKKATAKKAAARKYRSQRRHGRPTVPRCHRASRWSSTIRPVTPTRGIRAT